MGKAINGEPLDGSVRFLPPLLVLTGLVALMMGILQAYLRARRECQDISCEHVGLLEGALGAVAWFSVAVFLWVLAGFLKWMQVKRDALEG